MIICDQRMPPVSRTYQKKSLVVALSRMILIYHAYYYKNLHKFIDHDEHKISVVDKHMRENQKIEANTFNK